MRKIVVLAGVLLGLTAAKPVAPGDDAIVGPANTTRSWRGQAISVCIERLHALPDLSPDNLEGICGCAANEAIDMNGAGTLPPVEQGQLPTAMRGPLMMCTSRIRPERTSDVMRLTMDGAQTTPTPVERPATEAKSIDEVNSGPPAESQTRTDGGGFWDWLDSLRLPAWLTGASILWWIAVGIFVFGLLILKLRRRDPRNDLIGPPPSMRRGAPPQPPRRPDLPR